MRNPTGRRATKLTLSYLDGDIDVPAPGQPELNAIEEDVRRRTTRAIADVDAEPGAARPGADKCPDCPVRQLCDVSWDLDTQRQLASRPSSEDLGRPLVDVEADVGRRLGQRTWEAVVRSSRNIEIGSRIQMRTSPGDSYAEAVVAAARRVRVIDGFIETPDEDDNSAAAVGVSLAGEVFLLNLR